MVTVEERFWTRITQEGDCWRWYGGTDHYGYGRIYIGKRPVKAHRYAYELLVEDIPEGLVIDHLCGHRWCVIPWHMEPVTQAVNVTRGNKNAAAQRNSCRAGHPYNDVNTRVTSKQRVCRVCKRLAYDRAA